jgi:hypothetical protein
MEALNGSSLQGVTGGRRGEEYGGSQFLATDETRNRGTFIEPCGGREATLRGTTSWKRLSAQPIWEMSVDEDNRIHTVMNIVK